MGRLGCIALLVFTGCGADLPHAPAPPTIPEGGSHSRGFAAIGGELGERDASTQSDCGPHDDQHGGEMGGSVGRDDTDDSTAAAGTTARSAACMHTGSGGTTTPNEG